MKSYKVSREMRLLPIISLRGLVAMPGSVLQFDVGRKKSVRAVESVMRADQTVFLTAQTDAYIEDPTIDQMYSVGTVARVKQVIKMPGENMRVLAEGLYRGFLSESADTEPFFTARIGMLEDDASELDAFLTEAYLRNLREVFTRYASLVPRMSGDIMVRVINENDPARLCDFIATNTLLKVEDKQTILECQSVLERLTSLILILNREVEICSLDRDISAKLKEQMDKNQREYYMREQIKVLQSELGEDEDNSSAADQYRERIAALDASPDIKEQLSSESERLGHMPYGSQEATVVRSYLDLCLALPFGKTTKDRSDLVRARKILDSDHYGLERVKDRIIEFLAVHNQSPQMQGQILCLVGPPGVGKTSIAKSVAQALGRKFARMSLGGVRDEAEIRGHRRTYIGAMPGRIISAVKSAGSMNPVILLDEIDKLGADYRGDPASALLEALDPEQNKTFRDHFVDFDFDLSKVLFITTANTDDTIPPALYDRMDVMELASYTHNEKQHILKDHLLPRQLKKHALTRRILSVSDDALDAMITLYTKEAGVRNLERQAATLCRKATVRHQTGGGKSAVTAANISEFLGPPKFKPEQLPARNMTGTANGLAYTTVGGEMLVIEVCILDGTGKIELTGSLGDVMKESARAAISYIRSRADELGIAHDFYAKSDIHIHVPEGAVPKDGPSAGITIAAALISALTGRPFIRTVAMTGEITLRGRVLPIGGLKEKTMAAYKAGITDVILPQDNMSDLAELDDEVRTALCFIPVESMDDAIGYALEKQAERVNAIQAAGIDAAAGARGLMA